MTTTDPLPLFDLPQSRRSDPATSFHAADHIESTGRAGDQRAKCLAVVKAHPGRTAAEIAQLAGLDRHAASRRLPELRAAGLVVNGPARICTVQHSLGMTWSVA